jgi:CHRD domain
MIGQLVKEEGMRKIWLLLVALLALLMTVGLVAAGGRPFTTTLTGAAEVTAAGVPNQGDPDGIGFAHVTLNHGQGEVCFDISTSGVVLPIAAAHIHVGPATSTGRVVVGFLMQPDADGNFSGCVSADQDLIKAIIQHPENYYVNVHNAEFPSGALRGQLSK